METPIAQTSAALAKRTSRKLDVGCGPQCLPDAVGIDQFPFPGVEHVHDLNIAPWGLESDRFEYIRCMHAIEHFEKVHTVAREMFRICKDGAVIDFITPHYSSYASWGDPTHVHHFSLASLPLLFEQAIGRENYEVVSNELKFTGSGLDLFGWIIYKLSRKQYEKKFAWIFPCNEVHTTIRIRKSTRH